MKIAIYGIGGHMGTVLYNCIRSNGNDEVLCGIDKFADKTKYCVPVYNNCREMGQNKPDVIIDFSVREAIYDYLPYAVKNKIPCVIATTGYNTEESTYIQNDAKLIPIFKTGNMSLGINVILHLAKIGAQMLANKADIEIIEQHHNQKVDAPSGTALLLADGIKSVTKDMDYVCGRSGLVGKRTDKEIGIHSVRGGSVVGKHEVLFLMNDEIISIKHEAQSKTVFALGSINAAHFIVDKEPGLYDMDDMLKL